MSTAAEPPVEMAGFGHLSVRFDSRVLRPRPWTEHQSEWAAELLSDAPPGPVLEICAGVGHIGLLALAGLDRHLVLVDVNPVACDFARVNAAATPTSVDVREGRMEEALRPHERFAVIIADPPWVPTESTRNFPDDPLIAIDGGDDGMNLAWACLDVVSRHLADGGSSVLQLGTADQCELVDRRLADRPDLGLRLLEIRTFEGRGSLARLVRA